MDGEVSELGSWGMKTALKLQELSPGMRQAVDGLLDPMIAGPEGGPSSDMQRFED